MMSLHVHRLDPGTTLEDVIRFLQPIFQEVKCEALVSTQPTVYALFKVNINASNGERASDPSLWPEGVCVRKFFRPKPKN